MPADHRGLRLDDIPPTDRDQRGGVIALIGSLPIRTGKPKIRQKIAESVAVLRLAGLALGLLKEGTNFGRQR